jgi:hypothetical protein
MDLRIATEVRQVAWLDGAVLRVSDRKSGDISWGELNWAAFGDWERVLMLDVHGSGRFLRFPLQTQSVPKGYFSWDKGTVCSRLELAGDWTLQIARGGCAALTWEVGVQPPEFPVVALD